MAGGRVARAASVATALVIVGCGAGAGRASAGDFELDTCLGDQINHSTDAYLPLLTTPLMKVVRDCHPNGPSPFGGVLTGNLKHAGRSVSPGAVAAVILNAPPGTEFTQLVWSSTVKRGDCRYALQMWADGPSTVQPILNMRAGRGTTCGKAPPKLPSKPVRIRYAATHFDSAVYNIVGTNRIVQRAVCVGAKGHGCSRGASNYIKTILAQVTVHDDSPPVVSITPDTPLARGEWVGGDQALHYVASDNVGVGRATAMLGPKRGGIDDSRVCASSGGERRYDQQIPCPNGPGSITVKTRDFTEGTQPLVVRAEDAAGNVNLEDQPQPQPSLARIDNTPPQRVDVGVAGGEQWRNVNDFAAVWANSPEPDRAPLMAVDYKLCPAAGGTCSRGEQTGADIARLAMAVPTPGEWKLSLWRRDAAGNVLEGNASVPVSLRYDPEAPHLAFEPSPADDPTRISVSAIDGLSGVASGSIEIAREGSGSGRASRPIGKAIISSRGSMTPRCQPARTSCGRGDGRRGQRGVD